jgi:pyrophosphatase PpaX
VKNYKYFIFDWDGTLANTLEVWFNAYITLFEQYGLKVSYKEVSEKAYGDPLGCIKFGIQDFEEFNNRLFLLVKKQYATAKLYPQVKETLHFLKRKDYKLFLFTSTNRQLIINSLKKSKLDIYFDLIIGREDVNKLKPDPQGIQIIIEKYSCPRNQAIIIGDTDKDILAGKKSRIDTILFMPHQNLKYYNLSKFEKLKPTYKSKSMKDIKTLISTN